MRNRKGGSGDLLHSLGNAERSGGKHPRHLFDGHTEIPCQPPGANPPASCNVASPAFEPSFTTQLGAPWMSACTYRSPSFRCFFTIASFVFASRPPMTRNPSEEIGRAH